MFNVLEQQSFPGVPIKHDEDEAAFYRGACHLIKDNLKARVSPWLIGMSLWLKFSIVKLFQNLETNWSTGRGLQQSTRSSRYHRQFLQQKGENSFVIRVMDEKRIVICTLKVDTASLQWNDHEGYHYSTATTTIEIFNRWTLELERVCWISNVNCTADGSLIQF